MHTRVRRRRRVPAVPLVIAFTCLLGVLVLLYPTAASWLSEYEQSTLIDDFTVEAGTAGSDEHAAQLDAARLYNEQLFGAASVGAHERIPQADASRADADGDYLQQLASDDHGLMARLKIPAIDLDLPIYHGTSDAVLNKGVGHLEGTALPVGGLGTHSVLTGHRGLASAELFTRLDEVAIGDTFTIEVAGEVLAYRVIATQVVEPDETQTLVPDVRRDLVTLVTCTPLGINSHRILVTAERVLPTPPEDLAAAGAPASGPGLPWWVGVIAATVAGLVIYLRRAAVR